MTNKEEEEEEEDEEAGAVEERTGARLSSGTSTSGQCVLAAVVVMGES